MSDPRVAEAMRLADAPWVIRCHLMPEPYRAALEAHLTQLAKEAAQAAYAECARLGWKTPAHPPVQVEKGLEPVAPLHLSRLAMATLSAQNLVMHEDGALYDPELLRLFELACAHPPVQPTEPVAERVLMQRRLQSATDLCENEWYPWEEVFGPHMTKRQTDIFEYAWFESAHLPVQPTEPVAQDAARYRWLRGHGVILSRAAGVPVHLCQYGIGVDAAIDAAMGTHPPVQPTLPDQVQAAVDEHALQPTEPVAMRQAFETWARDQMLMDSDDLAWESERNCYRSPRTHQMWQAYRAAARSHPLAQPTEPK